LRQEVCVKRFGTKLAAEQKKLTIGKVSAIKVVHAARGQSSTL
jgi:hypothetical protein